MKKVLLARQVGFEQLGLAHIEMVQYLVDMPWSGMEVENLCPAQVGHHLGQQWQGWAEMDPERFETEDWFFDLVEHHHGM